jgi:pyruvate formate lyase activating enzyme
MLDRPPTPAETLQRARRIAIENGVRYAYTGNVIDPVGQTTRCAGCGADLIVRQGYEITGWHLADAGRCDSCGLECAGVFEAEPGTWGERRMPVSLRE